MVCKVFYVESRYAFVFLLKNGKIVEYLGFIYKTQLMQKKETVLFIRINLLCFYKYFIVEKFFFFSSTDTGLVSDSLLRHTNLNPFPYNTQLFSFLHSFNKIIR
jgi:hypothetical protein